MSDRTPKVGDKYVLQGIPEVRLTIRAVYNDGNATGTISAPGVGVIMRGKIRVHRIADQWILDESQ